MNLLMMKTISGWAPANKAASDEHEKQRVGQTIGGKFTKVRNAAFHRKLFALLNIAFDMWEPGEINSKYGVPEKNFDQFREDLTILAGFYKIVIRADGTTRPIAKSISFAKMDDNEFERLYSAMIDVILKHIIPKSSRSEIDEMVRLVIDFA